MTEIEKLKQTLHQICNEIENQSIKNDVYYEASMFLPAQAFVAEEKHHA